MGLRGTLELVIEKDGTRKWNNPILAREAMRRLVVLELAPHCCVYAIANYLSVSWVTVDRDLKAMGLTATPRYVFSDRIKRQAVELAMRTSDVIAATTYDVTDKTIREWRGEFRAFKYATPKAIRFDKGATCDGFTRISQAIVM